MSLLEEVRKELEEDIAESPNTPNPLRLEPWGEDRVLGIVVPPMERRGKFGILLETQASAPISSAMQIIKVSDRVTDEFPKLKRLKEQYDPEATGELFDGPYVTFTRSGASPWPYGQHEFVVVHARSIRGAYTPHYEGKEYDFNESEA